MRRAVSAPPTAAPATVVAPALTGCPGPAAPPATYYLALGDSLSQGVQPDAAGASVETADGYADQLYAALRRGDGHAGLELVKLGCPGETTEAMIDGGICRYQGGSQLAAADAFLRAHRGRVFLVTIDIGANDPEDCGGQPGLCQLGKCAVTGIPSAVPHLTAIMARLTAAAGPGVLGVGINYFLPAPAECRHGRPDTEMDRAAERQHATATKR